MTTLREAIAQREHEKWADYMGYFLNKLVEDREGNLIIPAFYVEALRRLIVAPYADLSEEQKDNDRAEADKTLAVVKQHVPTFWTPFPGNWEVIDIPYEWDYDGNSYKVMYSIEYERVMFIFARPLTHNGIPVEERALIQVRWKDERVAKGYLLDRGELLHWYLGIQALTAVLLTEDWVAVKTLLANESTTGPE